MTSSRIVLIFLGLIFLIIVILSSGRIAQVLRTRLGSYLPTIPLLQNKTRLTPTPTQVVKTFTPSPTTQIFGRAGETKGGIAPTKSVTSEIPATGPREISWLLMGASFVLGLFFKKFSFRN